MVMRVNQCGQGALTRRCAQTIEATSFEATSSAAGGGGAAGPANAATLRREQRRAWIALTQQQEASPPKFRGADHHRPQHISFRAGPDQERLTPTAQGRARPSSRIGRTARRGLVAVLLGLLPLTAAAQTKIFVTSTGHQLELPPVTTLDCTELDSILTRITGTNYRPIGQPRPSDPQDEALFAYEDAASIRWQENCERGPTAVQHYGSFGKAGARSWGFGQ